MMLGARTAAWAKSVGWVNPYQTDDNALIAMFDGEWNVSGGVHDSNSPVWNDLVGGRAVNVGEGCSFGDKFFFVGENKNSQGNFVLENYYSFRIVFRYRSYARDGKRIIVTCCPTKRGLRKYVEWIGWSYGLTGLIRDDQLGGWRKPVLVAVNFKNDNNKNSDVVIQRFPKTTSQTYENWGKDSELYDRFTILSDSPRTSLEFYTIQFFNRMLTSDELNIFEEFDKSRFNIPDAS